MQSKKGFYLIGSLIAIIVIFFLVLFFVHEDTLENGILFKISFEYENAQDITYNFYNQSGKIEKVEQDGEYENAYLLKKTDYNTIKLLRRLLKGRQTMKSPSNEEGITIYNGQNKRYYLLPFESEKAEELSNLIVDGYIHSEMNRIKKEENLKELYLYEDEKEGLTWTKNGSLKRIINTYVCEVEDCMVFHISKEDNETVLWDKVNYIYNYKTGYKEVINTSEPINEVEFLKDQNQILGISLTNDQGKTAFYDLEKKEVLTPFESQSFSLITKDLYLNQKEGEEKEIFTVVNYKTMEEIKQIEMAKSDLTTYWMEELKNNQATFYLFHQKTLKEEKIQVYNASFEPILEGTWYDEVNLEENGNLIVSVDGTTTEYDTSKEEAKE